MPQIFLAPRSGEQSADNFEKTVQGGYKKSDIEAFLTENDLANLKNRQVLYIWGNRPGGEAPWKKMNIGDHIFFYQQGAITYAGNLIYKSHNKKLADELWKEDKETGQSWEFVFFVDNLIPVKIDYSILRKFAGYKEKAVVQGFQSYKEDGVNNIILDYGSVENFIETYRVGPTISQLAMLDSISVKSDQETSAEDLEKLDEIVNEENQELVLKELRERNTTIEPQRIEAKILKIKRDILTVKKLKEIYNNECQICGFVIEKANGGRYSEVAHIKALSDFGEDNIKNMLVLCPNHHKMLDFGKMEIRLESKEVVIGVEVIKLKNKHL